jgi:hypothetical protein
MSLSGRVRVYATGSCKVGRRRRQVSGKTIGMGSFVVKSGLRKDV